MRLSEMVLQILLDEGIDRVFGNPGTTELPLVDQLVGEQRLRYVLGLHEGPLVSMADGYARATGRTSFVNLHVAAGTANGLIGMMNALRSRTPLVVLAGQQDSRHLIQDPMLSGDLVGLASAASKWAVEARRADEVPTLLRRAFREAATPPWGPVFVSVPMDLFDEEIAAAPPAATRLEPSTSVFDLEGAAKLLLSGRQPAVVAGDGVGRRGAVHELVSLVESLGARVYHAPMNDRLDFPMNHPSYAGMLPPENARIRERLDHHDVVLLAGARAFVPHHYSPAAAVGPGTRLIQIDDDAAVIGRNYPVEIGLAGDLRTILGDLAAVVDSAGGRREPLDAGRVLPDVPVDSGLPLDPRTAAATVAAHLPSGAVLVEEAITTGLLLREHLTLSEPDSFHHTVGGGLGWGIGAAVGVAMGRPGHPVVAALGDGCAMFGVQGLWTAAREQLPITFVVFDNGEYRTLKQTLGKMRDGRVDNFVGMDLGQPDIDWPGLADAFGVPGVRITGAEHLAELLAGATADQGPRLVQVPLQPFGGVG
jgi:benzoylformate decarboxylase